LENPERLVKALNSALDNLWIGDVDGAATVLEQFAGTPEVKALTSSGRKAREIRRSVNKELRNRQVKRARVPQERASLLSNRLREGGIEADQAALGAVAFRVEKFSGALQSYVKENKRQERKGKTEISKTERKLEITTLTNYKFSVLVDSPWFEIRACFLSKIRSQNSDSLKAVMAGKNLRVAEPSINGQSTVIRAYSATEYVEATIEPYTALLRLSMSKPDENRAKEIARVVFDFFTSESQ
jgi:hypothetical protein